MYWSHCTDESLLVAIKKVVLDSEPHFMLFTRVQDQFYLEAAGEQLRARAILCCAWVRCEKLASGFSSPPGHVLETTSQVCVSEQGVSLSSPPGLPLIPVVAQSLTFSPPHKFSPAGLLGSLQAPPAHP